jgi:hypothetical protein
MNTSQIKGIVIMILAMIVYSLLDINLLKIISGILCAIGLGFIFKWIPFNRQDPVD